VKVIFQASMYEIMQDNMQACLDSMHEITQEKMQAVLAV
jgi:hypothetical protein